MAEGIIFADEYKGELPTGKAYETIIANVDHVASLNASKKVIETKIAMVRSELDTLMEQYQIVEIDALHNTCKLTKSKRFKGWDNEAEVFALIPRKMQTIKVMTPDRKKIKILVDKGKLPEELLDHEVMTEITQLRFRSHDL